MSELYRFTPGTGPILVSVPHAGTHIPPELRERMTGEALDLPDTDWHVEKLYDFAPAMGLGLLVATPSRYVVDLNRDPSGRALYPGADNTELVPLTTFSRAPIYRAGAAPSAQEAAQRVETYWQPYHQRLEAELQALKRKFGIAVLWDGHSIPSEVPRFFEGRLPDFNFGSARGASAAPDFVHAATRPAERAAGLSGVLDGRFTGGYITRRYGRPGEGLHAIQLELAQIAYMDERPPFPWDAERARRVRDVLADSLRAVSDWALGRAKR